MAVTDPNFVVEVTPAQLAELKQSIGQTASLICQKKAELELAKGHKLYEGAVMEFSGIIVRLK